MYHFHQHLHLQSFYCFWSRSQQIWYLRVWSISSSSSSSSSSPHPFPPPHPISFIHAALITCVRPFALWPWLAGPLNKHLPFDLESQPHFPFKDSPTERFRSKVGRSHSQARERNERGASTGMLPRFHAFTLSRFTRSEDTLTFTDNLIADIAHSHRLALVARAIMFIFLFLFLFLPAITWSSELVDTTQHGMTWHESKSRLCMYLRLIRRKGPDAPDTSLRFEIPSILSQRDGKKATQRSNNVRQRLKRNPWHGVHIAACIHFLHPYKKYLVHHGWTKTWKSSSIQ